MDFLHNGHPQRPNDILITQLSKSQKNKITLKPYDLTEPRSQSKTLSECFHVLILHHYEFITQQYDSIVQGEFSTVTLQGRGRINAELVYICPVLSSQKGIILSQGLYPKL